MGLSGRYTGPHRFLGNGLELLRPGVWGLRVGIIGRMYLAFSACLALTGAF
jgi:hypothetical protein